MVPRSEEVLLWEKLVENTPSLTIRQMKAVGAFDPEFQSGELNLAGFRLPATITRFRNKNWFRVTILVRDRNVKVLVKIRHAKLKFGMRPFFICPLSNKKCETLFFQYGTLASRSALNIRYASQSANPEAKIFFDSLNAHWRLTGEDGYKVPRGARREAALAAFSRTPEAWRAQQTQARYRKAKSAGRVLNKHNRIRRNSTAVLRGDHTTIEQIPAQELDWDFAYKYHKISLTPPSKKRRISLETEIKTIVIDEDKKGGCDSVLCLVRRTSHMKALVVFHCYVGKLYNSSYFGLVRTKSGDWHFKDIDGCGASEPYVFLRDCRVGFEGDRLLYGGWDAPEDELATSADAFAIANSR